MLYNYFNFPASPSIAQQSHHRAARPKEFNTGDESEDEMSNKLREAGLVESDDSGEDRIGTTSQHELANDLVINHRNPNLQRDQQLDGGTSLAAVTSEDVNDLE